MTDRYLAEKMSALLCRRLQFPVNMAGALTYNSPAGRIKGQESDKT